MYDIMPRGGRRKRRSLAEFHLRRMILSPAHWKACKLGTTLNWSIVKFTYANAAMIPKTRGVYTFVVQPGIADHPYCSYLLYVGQTEEQDFRRRYRQYLNEGRAGDRSVRPHITEMLEKWEGFLWFCFASIDKTESITDVENTLLTAYLPPSNREFPATVSRSLRELFST